MTYVVGLSINTLMTCVVNNFGGCSFDQCLITCGR